MRLLLLACGPMNVAGAVGFAPPFPQLRSPFGLPESHPLYLWVIAAWILAFGVAFFHQGLTGRANRAVLALAVAGKGSFGGLVIGMSLSGELPPVAAAVGLPDVALAAVFAGWLWRTAPGRP